MQHKIKAALTTIEQEKKVKILYACEAGSRAWGFHSTDSDWDVRFLYVHKMDFYLSIDSGRDVIECPISESLDISGWDLRKSLKLFRKSNPPLLEWLNSPIVYVENGNIPQRLRDLAKVTFSTTACMYHYFHMANGNYRQYLRGDTVWIKKYFYVLRPVLAILWLEKGLGTVPVKFSELMEIITDKQLRADIEQLLTKKKQGIEMGYSPKIHSISNFVDEEIARLKQVKFPKQKQGNNPTERLNNIFREALRDAK